MKEEFNSPIFGRTRNGTPVEREAVSKMVEETPVTVFQELNKALNKRGMMISIAPMPVANVGP